MLFSCISHFIRQLKIAFVCGRRSEQILKCLCNEIACHAMDLSKVFIGRVSRQALRSTLLFGMFVVDSQVVINKNWSLLLN